MHSILTHIRAESLMHAKCKWMVNVILACLVTSAKNVSVLWILATIRTQSSVKRICMEFSIAILDQRNISENAWIREFVPPNQMIVAMWSMEPTVAYLQLTLLSLQRLYSAGTTVQTQLIRNAVHGKIVDHAKVLKVL